MSNMARCLNPENIQGMHCFLLAESLGLLFGVLFGLNSKCPIMVKLAERGFHMLGIPSVVGFFSGHCGIQGYEGCNFVIAVFCIVALSLFSSKGSLRRRTARIRGNMKYGLGLQSFGWALFWIVRLRPLNSSPSPISTHVILVPATLSSTDTVPGL